MKEHKIRLLRRKCFYPAVAFLLCLMLAGCNGGEAAEEETAAEIDYNSQGTEDKENGEEETEGNLPEEPEEESLPSGEEEEQEPEGITESFDLSELPDYSGTAYVEVNGNVPYFQDSELTEDSFETYSELDDLGRCMAAYACVGQDIMPTEERGEIGPVKPSGWQTVKYNDIIDGNYLYNRCHLIGYQLTGENADERNLITGTRYLNMEGMLPFENMIADYVESTGHHVLYRVTPVFEEDDLVARGVLMEAESVEDEGAGVLFNVFCYNVQPGIVIDYADGSSRVDEAEAEKIREAAPATEGSEDASVKADDAGGSPSDGTEVSGETARSPEISDSEGVSSPEISESPDTAPSETAAVQEPSGGSGNYAVNAKNGKIHRNGACPATGSGKNAMKEPVYFDTYEEAEAYSVSIAPGQDKRKCGNCW